MLHRVLNIQRLSRITHPHISPNQPRMPENLPRNNIRDLFVGRLPKPPLVAFEIVIPAGELHRHQFPRFQKLHLPAVHFFTQRVDDRRFHIFGLERRHNVPYGGSQVHRDRGMQAIGIPQLDVRMQYPEIRSRAGMVERPGEIDQEWKPLQCDISVLASSDVLYLTHYVFIPQVLKKNFTTEMRKAAKPAAQYLGFYEEATGIPPLPPPVETAPKSCRADAACPRRYRCCRRHRDGASRRYA